MIPFGLGGTVDSSVVDDGPVVVDSSVAVVPSDVVVGPVVVGASVVVTVVFSSVVVVGSLLTVVAQYPEIYIRLFHLFFTVIKMFYKRLAGEFTWLYMLKCIYLQWLTLKFIKEHHIFYLENVISDYESGYDAGSISEDCKEQQNCMLEPREEKSFFSKTTATQHGKH